MTGILYLVATPIGNLEDITLRALRILKEVNLIACEDTRQTIKLLNHFLIEKPTISYHEHNEQGRTEQLINSLLEGKSIALVSDAGTPIISDPGLILVKKAIDRKIPVIALPGASALLPALITSGLESSEFTFIGFLPARSGERRKKLLEIKPLPFTIICYESPYRILESLSDAKDILGTRQAIIARELTKLYEETLRGTLAELLEQVKSKPLKGELVLVIEGQNLDSQETELVNTIQQAVKDRMEKDNLDQMSALKAVAKALGISKSEAYRRLQLELKDY
ncbi:MAG: 16S rRNA (cytidine(1402)-2'-O)-methyltransferase [Acidobacteria bacterium]|nr:16S rRNA (cytidine(1402)-2'-O)-methyltransferase [Acidobacteriota bacterium]